MLRSAAEVAADVLAATRQTKFIRYTLLVPRAVPLALRIPANLLKAGQQYSIRIVARDPNGNKSTLLIPFSV